MVAEEIIHKVVDEIAFGLISPKNLRKQSVVEIQTPDRAILRFAKSIYQPYNSTDTWTRVQEAKFMVFGKKKEKPKPEEKKPAEKKPEEKKPEEKKK